MSTFTSIADMSRALAPRFSLRLSVAESSALVFFVYMSLAAPAFGLGLQQCFFLFILNSVTAGTMIVLNRDTGRARWLSVARDLFPALLILVAYRESGLLVQPDLSHRLDRLFVAWDRVWLQSRCVQTLFWAATPWAQHYLEFAYLLCYPLVPLGAAAVCWGSRWSRSSKVTDTPGRRPVDDFWAAVLLATLACYAVYPYFPLTPPRVLFHDVPGPHVEPLLRRWNFWLLDHYSVQACIFPSGHVAAATAVALAVRRHVPKLGWLFVLLAASVAVATVYGRYHYVADAAAGALVGIAAFALVRIS